MGRFDDYRIGTAEKTGEPTKRSAKFASYIVKKEPVPLFSTPAIEAKMERRKQPTRLEKMAQKIVNQLRIRAPSVNTDCYSLSGGNKQKVSVGKWVERKPDILLLNDPTIGIDVGAREDIYEVLSEMKKNGISMVLVSDDPIEYSILCDRIMFIIDGRVQKFFSPDEFRKVVGT